ncbi:MAG: 23S rRNA (pseudouridine(1915)-N(3))-methyltransferase RlmH [Calditrichaeota bacterium]|nr:MAG: 23S rRNA (pseudouridine(1915)-N(3))-methyltransferase RlmH [Calditrichota bacterium]
MNTPCLRAAADDFQNRLKHYVDLKIVELKDVPAKNKTVTQVQEAESSRILENLPPRSYLVVLDRSGKQVSSSEFANFIEQRRLHGPKVLAFAIGGPHGFSRTLLQRADWVLSLSKMTFPHEQTRVILLEQIYRAFTILKGEKYHK